MKSFLAVFALVAAVSAGPVQFFPMDLMTDGRIVGGEDTEIEQAPHQVSLQVFDQHFCGGSIISANFVLTAGHCTTRAAYQYRVRAGSTLVNKGGSIHTVKEVIRHPAYSTNGYGVPINDVALLRLNEPIELDESRSAVKLFEQDEEAVESSIATITGWGRTNSGTPTILQTVSVPVVSKSKCNAAYKIFGGIPEGQICAAIPDGGKDSCQGDSGGPMLIAGKQSGVVSWGKGCGERGYPGVYAEVASYRDWIREKSGV